MACAAIIPELRKRGLVADLGAWFPWKSSEGWPMMDTTAIIFVNMPGYHKLCNDPAAILHAKDSTGLLSLGSQHVSPTSADTFFAFRSTLGLVSQ